VKKQMMKLNGRMMVTGKIFVRKAEEQARTVYMIINIFATRSASLLE